MKIRKIVPVGDQAVSVMFEEKIDLKVNQKVQKLHRFLKEHKIQGIRESIPSYCSLLIFYDPLQISYKKVTSIVKKVKDDMHDIDHQNNRMIEIPVVYGGKYGEDLETVAVYAGMSQEEVIQIHTEPVYYVYQIGFLPGFPYLGGLDPRIHAPRLANPRLEIPAGSVGIGGEQTGIYPLASPGGWQLIGRTPLALYQKDREPPVLLQAGDRVKFVRIREEDANF